jgi:HD-GYP domain-containing protein (c-di-GMP phosphodiesterase class II)
MSSSESASTDVHHSKAKFELLEPLCTRGGANLAFDSPGSASWPVLLHEIEVDKALIVDISAFPELATRLERGDGFHLLGHVNGALVKTDTLTVSERVESVGRLLLRCNYPEIISVTHRRRAFRAALSPAMGVSTKLYASAEASPIDVELKNLSLGGCLLTMTLASAVSLEVGKRFRTLRVDFLNGQRLSLKGTVRHAHPNESWTTALVGCEFDELGFDSERLLWYCVKEIERERARNALTSDKELEPSELFRIPDSRRPVISASKSVETPRASLGKTTARYLKRIADYLNAQILQLRNGGNISMTLLSHYSDALLQLEERSCESLLYAIGYLHDESPLVRHSLGVAIRALDLARWQGYANDTLKTIAASALIHDLGKALLPGTLLDSPTLLTAKQREALAAHVEAVMAKLVECRWLAIPIAKQVIEQVNERLDGSGYPQGLGGDDISDIGRMLAVVDVIEALSRPRADRDAWPLVECYRHVLGAPAQFDNAWAQRYVRHFGMTPIGTLVRYSSGALAWVQRLDAQGQPVQVHMVLNVKNPKQHLDQVLANNDIEQLGQLECVVNPADFHLALT